MFPTPPHMTLTIVGSMKFFYDKYWEFFVNSYIYDISRRLVLKKKDQLNPKP
jgi:hypothetical protein